ncbi:hypothetical protein C7S18_19895 [Ahniella affigens]|uniref:Uncharacterized protein n=1 Tax=Ahniella affigens TaxID=2021234 RepID=A0A2P1PWS3_9GAMM|nr:hypothetical protein C7S18_19895 [Ahniella affigens]
MGRAESEGSLFVWPVGCFGTSVIGAVGETSGSISGMVSGERRKCRRTIATASAGKVMIKTRFFTFDRLVLVQSASYEGVRFDAIVLVRGIV